MLTLTTLSRLRYPPVTTNSTKTLPSASSRSKYDTNAGDHRDTGKEEH